jgi:hypothetical protein
MRVESVAQAPHGGAARLRSASMSAMAQDARRVVRESERLVSTMGTRAPMTMPALSAPPRN